MPFTVWMCWDCYVWHATGDLSAIDTPEREAEVIAARGIGADESIIVGDGHNVFSHSSCDVCRDWHGGERFSGSLVGAD